MKQNLLLEKYKKNGFVVVRKVFKKQQIIKVLKELEIVKHKASKLSKKNYHKTTNGKFNTIHNINTFINEGNIIKISKSLKIINLARMILNDKPQLRNIEFFLKPKKNKMKTPFHQDNFFWNIVDANGINIWIACSKASKANGGICYLQESQNLGTIKHEMSYVKGTSQQIPSKVLKNLKFKKIFPKINTGDIIIHNCEVIHGSENNKSEKDRIGLVLSFKGANSMYDTKKIASYKKKLKKSLKKIYN